MDFSKFPFNILHRGKIDERLMRRVNRTSLATKLVPCRSFTE